VKLFREKAGVISRKACWVIVDKGWLYASNTMFGLLRTYIMEYKNDRHLCG